MKKTYSFIIFLMLIIFVLNGCGNNYADISDNVKYVSAAFYLEELDNDSEDRLIKVAELIYTKMNITPKYNVTVKGVSFSAKLKNNTEEDLYLNIYITNRDKILNNDFNNIIIMSAYKISLSDTEKEITILFNNPYTFTITGLESLNSIDNMCIEFLNDNNQKNTATFFSLNNVQFLTE